MLVSTPCVCEGEGWKGGIYGGEHRLIISVVCGRGMRGKGYRLISTPCVCEC